MKTIIAFALLIVGISAGPHLGQLSRADLRNERLVTGSIESAIEDVSQQIKDAGLDPLNIEQESLAYALPVPVLFNMEALVEDFLFTGLSNIQINNLNFGIITTRLTFDIELPRIAMTVGNSRMSAEVFGSEHRTEISGTFAANSIRFNGNVRVSVGIISGISIRDVNVNFSIGSIESDLNVVLANHEVSNYINTLLGDRIPSTLDEFASEINQLLEILVEQVASEIL